MADEELAWGIKFDLNGRGLDDAAHGLATVEGQLAKGQKAIIEFDRSANKLTATFSNMGDGAAKAHKGFSLMEAGAKGAAVALVGVGAAVTAAVKGFEALDRFGDKAFAAIAERQNTIRGYTALLGDAGKAQKEFQWDQDFGKKAPFKTEDIENLHRRMISSGTMNVQEAREGTLAITDLAALQGGERGRIALEKGSQMYAEIGEQGLTKMHLRQISGDLNLSMERIEKSAGKLLGWNQDRVQQGIHHGIFQNSEGGKLFQEAIKEATKELLGENRLGQYSEKSSTSLQTLLINREEQSKRLIKSEDMEELPGIKRFKRSLMDQADLYDRATESGKRMKDMLADFTSTSAQVSSVWADFETEFLKSFSQGYSDELKAMGVNADGSISPIKELAHSLGELGPIAADAMHAIVPAMKAAAEAVQWAVDKTSDASTGFKMLGYALKSGSISKAVAAYDGGLSSEEKRIRREEHAKDLEFKKAKDQRQKEMEMLNGGAPVPVSLTAEGKLRKFDTSKFKAHGAGGSGAGLGEFGNFRPDYTELFEVPGLRARVAANLAKDTGWHNPIMTEAPLHIPGMHAAAQAEHAAEVAERQRQQVDWARTKHEAAVNQTFENVEIMIDGAHMPTEVAKAVRSELAQLGRLARTPSPAGVG